MRKLHLVFILAVFLLLLHLTQSIIGGFVVLDAGVASHQGDS